ncbi:class I SAM-dependent methyltransferase [Kitasatospora viridis]|uniref:Methyltransferase family protein n=1 Tax=Kitasatospora viridis TaxID=281105 RepID=A0A561T699_9ACTN|nr:class I SAM-dependent methyltransferase [Kitasatospora viridis]TWF82632.1 methyltransferase family protein [Kitasatospora viridis]
MPGAAYRERIVRRRFATIAADYQATVGERRSAYNDAVDEIVHAAVRNLPGAVTVLDAGCGTGARWSALKQRLGSVVVRGVDASAEMAALAAAAGLDEVRVATLDELPCPDGSCSVVTCLFFVLCYTTSHRQRRRAAAELFRVTAPGGLLFVDAINTWHLGEGLAYRRGPLALGWDYARSLLDPRLLPGDKLYATRHHGRRLAGFHHSFTHRSLTRLMTGAGFRPVHRHTLGYNTGRPHERAVRGQLVHVYRRPAK